MNNQLHLISNVSFDNAADVGGGDIDILAELNKVDVETPEKPEEVAELPETDDTLAIDLPDKEETDEELAQPEPEEDIEFENIPRRQEILKEFPELFKKFPAIEKVIYREQQYAELFPSIDEARQAIEQITDFRKFQNDLYNGDPRAVFASIKSDDPQAFSNLIGNFLAALKVIDTDLYFREVNKIIKSGLLGCFQMAKKNGDDQLEIASQLLHKFLYGSPEITVQEDRPVGKSPEQEKFENERVNFEKGKLDAAVNDVVNRINNLFKATVEKHIDPRNTMTPYVRANAVKDVMRILDRTIGEDARFRQILDRKWKNAATRNYDEVSKADIRNALISKSRAVLRPIIQSVRADALKGSATRTREAAEKKDERPVERGRPAASHNDNGKGKTIPKGMSTRDYILADD